MNPATNYSNVGGGMPGGAKLHFPQNSDNQVIFNHAVQALQSQPPFSGWRAEVTLSERAMKVYQILSSLRLIQPQINVTNAAYAALGFEHKALKDANQKADYDRECSNKLAHIRDTRARQAAVLQNGMVPQGGHGAGMTGVGQNQVQGQIPPQMNRQMQASPLPGQQQMSMGMNDPNHRAALQQQQQQQAAMLQQQQQQQQQQRVQQRSTGNISLPDDLNSLPPQELEHVRRLAHQMLTKTSPEDMEKIKMNLQNMTPEQKQYLSRRQIDPMTYFFRSQALTQLKRHKKNRMEMAQAQNPARLDPNNTMMGDPMMSAQQRQVYENMMNLQRNSAFPGNTQPGIDPSSFIGNVENIQGQQADGLRSQEAGQLVVPASGSQINQPAFSTSQNVFQAGQQQQQQPQPPPQQQQQPQQLGPAGQANMNGAGISPQFINQPHLHNPQPVQQDRSQQAAASQGQTQAARAHAAQKAQLGMSQAGRGNPQMQQQIPQQSPAMPMLNRPMPGQMSPTQMAAQTRPPSRPAGIGQQHPAMQSVPGQPAMQARPQIPPNLPPMVQQQLAQMTPEQLNVFLMAQRRRAVENSIAQAQQQPASMQQNLSQPGQGQHMANGQMSNNQNLRASLGLQQQIPNVAGGQMQNQMPPGQQMPVQQQQQQQQQRQQAYKLRLLQQQSNGMEMTPEQVKEMDRLPFPPSLINSNQNSSFPKNIKTWGQLKQLAGANPQVLGGRAGLSKLMTLQKLHLAQIVAQGKENNRNPDQMGQGNNETSSMVPPQQFPPGNQQGPINLPAVPPITANDIKTARQRLGEQEQRFTDEQLRDLLYRNRINKLQAAQAGALQNLAVPNANQGQPAQPGQPGQQPPTIPPQNMQQAKQPPQTPQSAKPPQSATPGKGTKGVGAAPKQPAKRKSTNEHPMEAQNSSGPIPAQPAIPQGAAVPGAPRPNPPFAMTPQQRLQFEAHLRRQQGQQQGQQPRISSRASAEEAWNNLPDNVKQLYNDISRTVPVGEPIPFTPEQKAAMAPQFRECTELLSRMDTLVNWFVQLPNQERIVRSLLGMRVQLMRQFKPVPEWTLNDQITISPDRLARCISYIRNVQAWILRANQQHNQPPGQRPNVPQGPTPVAPANQNNMPALNASNLQQLQQQEEALQRARRASSQTASGSAPGMPPAPFGAPSPQGVPHAYGPGSMPPEKLKLPPPKKRKHSHAGATPGQAPTPGTPTSKTPTSKPEGKFRCKVPECQHHYHGLASQAALEKHIEENHKVEETIEDPLEFAIQSMQSSLIKEEKAEAPSSKKGVAAQHKTEMKPEGVTPTTGGATPMGRIPSQLGLKSVSPQQMTPRPSAGKTPAAAAMKTTISKEGKTEPGKLVQPSTMDTAMKDPWADSAISLEAIHDTFMDLGEDGLGVDPMEEFLNSEMFTSTQSKETPDSVETGAAAQTPKDGEFSKDEDVNIKVGSASDDENWIPSDWLYLPSHFVGDPLANGPGEISWESIDQKDSDFNDDAGTAIYAM